MARTVTKRFVRQIGDRTYIIEASPVAVDRWRAQIARRPGMPSALMPFYGPTADAAAALLEQWLTLAHRARSEAAR
jgi:hypothetical protein